MRSAAAMPPDSAPSVPSHFQNFLAFDFGRKRTGMASGNRMLGQAKPQCTISAEGDARFAQIEKRIREWQPDALVVGVPFHPDGAPHATPRPPQRLARQLEGPFPLPVYRVDERY